MSITPTISIYRPDLMMFEQILLQTWRLLCRSQKRHKENSVNFQVFAHIYRGYLVSQWVLLYQTKYKLNSVSVGRIYKVKKKEICKIYQDLLIPLPIFEACNALLQPVIITNRIFYPAPLDLYVDYDEQDYFHGTILDGANSKSIDFAASYAWILKSFRLKLLPHSIDLKTASFFPGHTHSQFKMKKCVKDEKIVEFEKNLAKDFSTVLKPLPLAHKHLKIMFENCFDSISSNFRKFEYIKSLKPTKAALCNQQGKSLSKLDIYSKCSFLTQEQQRLSLTINSDTMCKIIINRKDDFSDFNPENSELLDMLEKFFSHESGVSDFMNHVIKSISLTGEKYPFPKFIKGEFGK